MNYFSISLIYIAFYALIGFTAWFTKSPWCLLAIFLTPNIKAKSGEKTDNKNTEKTGDKK